jgi:hypothetical protein
VLSGPANSSSSYQYESDQADAEEEDEPESEDEDWDNEEHTKSNLRKVSTVFERFVIPKSYSSKGSKSEIGITLDATEEIEETDSLDAL